MLSTVWKSSQPSIWHALPQQRTRRVVLPKHNLFMQQIICRGISFIDILATLNRLNFNELPLCSCTLQFLFLDPENYFVHFVTLRLLCLQGLLMFTMVCICFSLTATQGEILKIKPACKLFSMRLFLSVRPYTLHWRQFLLPCTTGRKDKCFSMEG